MLDSVDVLTRHWLNAEELRLWLQLHIYMALSRLFILASYSLTYTHIVVRVSVQHGNGD